MHLHDNQTATNDRTAGNDEPSARQGAADRGAKPEANEVVASDDQHLASLRTLNRKCRRMNRFRRKEALRTQVRDLALEGLSCVAISGRLALGKSTVHRWLQEMRQECRTKVADSAEMIANAVARYDSIYREAMQAWRNSKCDREVRIVEDIDSVGKDGESRTRKSVRTERRVGEVAFLAQARCAVDSICKILPLDCRPITCETFTNEDLSSRRFEVLDQVDALLEDRTHEEQINEETATSEESS